MVGFTITTQVPSLNIDTKLIEIMVIGEETAIVYFFILQSNRIWVFMVPWTVKDIKRALVGYCISHWREDIKICIVLLNNGTRNIIYSLNRSLNSQPQLIIFVPTNTIFRRFRNLRLFNGGSKQ